MFSICSVVFSGSGNRPRPAWQAEHPLERISPRLLRVRPIQLASGLVQKSLIVLILPSFLPAELTIAGASPRH